MAMQALRNQRNSNRNVFAVNHRARNAGCSQA